MVLAFPSTTWPVRDVSALLSLEHLNVYSNAGLESEAISLPIS